MRVIPGEHLVLPFRVAMPLACLAAAALIALWVWLHRLKRRAAARWLKALLLAARGAVGFLAILVTMDAVQHEIVFATNWPIWPLALTGAVAVEVLVLLYALERRIVSRPVGLALAGIRVTLALLVVVMLAQPVRSVEWSRSLPRFVAVLVDNSASMHVPDKQLTPAERIRLADLLAADVPARPFRIETTAQRLRELREKLAPHIDWLLSLREATPDARLKQLEGRRRAAREALEEIERAVADLAKALAAPLAGPTELDPRLRASLTTATDKLAKEIREPLAEAIKMLERGNLPSLSRDLEPLLAALRGASSALVKLTHDLRAIANSLDDAFYAALSADDRAKVDALALQNRYALARDLLYQQERVPGRKKPAPGLLKQLEDSYGVRLYTFASTPTEVQLDKGLPDPLPNPDEGRGTGDGKDAPTKGSPSPASRVPRPTSQLPAAKGAAELPPEQQQTDLAAALEKVITEMPTERLSGIILLTDGRHNAPSGVEAMARRIGLLEVPVCSIVFGGGAKPTTDAAVVAVEAPETVFAKDKVYVNAELRLDGLAGKTVRVRLYDGDTAVDSDEIRVQADSLRTRVQLTDEPKEAGMHAYRVRIEEVEGEVLTTNNERPLSVSVTSEQTKLLLIEGRPRWEFRYLKNLFSGRDRTVRLQYVVLRPDEIPGQPLRTRVPASAARPQEQPEASALPENEGEWMKFDVIVLGDVDPTQLREEDTKALKKFVEERGGTLIVVAGPRCMPHAYANTPLANLLPVAFPSIAEPDAYLPAPEKSFRIALTPEGRDHVIMRLRVAPEENLETWNAMPDIHWRHPLLKATQGAMVLAYAMPPDPPEFLAAKPAGEPPDEENAKLRQEFIRSHALISLHNVALGRVLCLSFDHTWRMRYHVGDPHHHRFWGQVLRWATSDRLPAGGNLVRLGTDRPRYPARSKVRVRAKIIQPDFSPVVSDEVTANVFAGTQLILRRKMQYVPNSLGIYTADLGELAGGSYRVELDAPAARGSFASDGVEKVSSDFFVEKAVPSEQIELSADRGLLERVATLTRGVVADPPRAADVLAALGPGSITHSERRQWALWDSWPLLTLIVVLAGAEWLLRKRARLP